MTTNAWDHAAEMADKHTGSGSGLFVRLANDGDKIIGAFVGDPYPREVHWGGERYEDCTGDGCSFCEEGKRSSLRVSMNFFVPDEDDMKIIEGGVMWFKDLLKVRDKYGLGRWFFEIERHGQAGDSKTRYSILPERQIDKEHQAQIDGHALHDLEKLVSGSSDDFDSYDNQSDRSIDKGTVAELIARLKALPRPALDAWLGELGIQRVRDLKASDEKAARALLDRIEADGKQEEQPSVDPFAE